MSETLGELMGKVERGVELTEAENKALQSLLNDMSDADVSKWNATEASDFQNGRGAQRRGRTLDGHAVLNYDDVQLNHSYDLSEVVGGPDGNVLDSLTAETDNGHADALAKVTALRAALVAFEATAPKRRGRPVKVAETVEASLSSEVRWNGVKPNMEDLGLVLGVDKRSARGRWKTVLERCNENLALRQALFEALAELGR